jgi:hypothetical protein
MQTIPQPSAYEIDRANRNREARGNMARKAELQAFCADRDQALVLGAKATGSEAKVREYDRPESGMLEEVRAARKWRTGIIMIGAVLIMAAVGDFLFGTPELVEPLANKLASLVIPMPEGDSEAIATEMPTVAPVAIRVITFSVFTLLITVLVKWIASTNELRLAVGRLAAGDDEGYRRIQRAIWLRRSIIVPFVVLVVIFFRLCYTTDLQKARDLVAIRHMDDAASVESTNPNEFGFGLNDSGELGTDEAVVKSALSVNTSNPVDLEEEARMIARPQVLIYSLLACAHCLVFLMPLGHKPDDISLASFNRRRMEKQAEKMRSDEERIILDLHSRLLDADPEMRDRLVIEAGPIARRMNEILGREAIEVPEMFNAPVSANSSGSSFTDSSRPNPDPSTPGPPKNHPSPEPQQPPRQAESPDDLYKAIFG